MSLVYWKEKTLYVNPTNQCTCACRFCVRNFSDGVYGFTLKLDHEPTPEELSQAVIRSWTPDFQEVAVVGFGEPTMNLEGVVAVGEAVKGLGPTRLRIDTNGHGLLIHPKRDVPQELADAGFEVVRVSLNAQDAKTYVRLCRPQHGEAAYHSMLEFAARCSRLMTLEMSVVDLPVIDIEACRRIADSMSAEFVVRPFRGPDAVLVGIRAMS
ncbi:MAG: radical SAM protein [Candidatus Thorarchaeota archaeon]|nr:radical SAM protein [Candidatus Thorarchaeota archaeon]